MSFFQESDRVTMPFLPGEGQRTADTEIATPSTPAGLTGARRSWNMIYGSNFAITRPEFVSFFTPAIGARIIRGMFNWIVSNGNVLLMFYQQGVGDWRVRARYLTNGTEIELTGALPGIATGMIGKPAGSRVYFALISDSGGGGADAYVWDGNNTSGVANVEKLFARPPVFTISHAAAAPNPGEVPMTAGTHNVAAVFLTKNGHLLRPGPVDSGGNVIPYTFTADGVSLYTFTLTPTGNWPNWLQSVEMVLTPKINLQKFYFVPDNFAAVGTVPTPNLALPITLRVGIDDTTLQTGNSARDLGDLQQILQQDAGGGAPFQPHAIAPGTNRMAYLAHTADLYLNIRTKVFVSAPDDYQYLTLDQHAFEAPGSVPLIALGWIGSTLYVFGENWTYARTDTGLLPVEWPPVETIDGQRGIGTGKPMGVLSGPARRYILVGHTSGLYRLAGAAYDEKPLSWFQGAGDWARINWAAAAWTFQIHEYTPLRLIVVMAPLDGAAAPTHLLVWDYTNGMSWDRVKYSRYNIQGWSPGAVEIGINPTTKRTELWVSNGNAQGPVLRWTAEPGEATVRTYADATAAGGTVGIDSQYVTPSAAVYQAGRIWNWIGVVLRLIGNGTISLWSWDMNGTEYTMAPITADTAPDVAYPRSMNMQAPSGALKVSNGAVAGSWFRLSAPVEFFLRLWRSA